ncbi:MAG: FAD-dependent oxidoreductase [Candidatus Competibacteraceae bacterium]|nr:FAD-dependent oxidoreductase [Candidatus Competibacteraceae bacterium]
MSGHDLAVIGAGPAGLSAAVQAAELGLKVVLLDEQTSPGGQIYRALEQASPALQTMLGPDYSYGTQLLGAMRQSPVDYRAGASVWQLNREREIGLLQAGKAQFISAARVLIAGGAQERPFPIPGWTLPGVMSAGAGQILLKGGALKPAQAVVLAGCGPLLYLLAWQYLQAGVRIAALLDTTPRANYRAAAPLLPGALGLPGYLRKGLTMLRAIRRAGVPVHKHVTGLRALGSTQLDAVEYQQQERWQRLDTSLLLLHQGVVPNVQMSRVAGCGHDWNENQLCWTPTLDEWGNTDIDGIMAAGDNGGILGARAAELSGRLAALESASQLQRIDQAERDRRAAPLHKQLQRERKARRFLDVLYRPLPQFRIPADDATLVCRCEEVSAGEIRRTVELGCLGPNQTKSFCRAGMGPCQGRMCGLTVAEIIAQQRGVPVAEVGYYRLRAPLKPITLGQLADAAE